MKKLCALLLSSCVAVSGVATAGFTLEKSGSLINNCKSAYLMDYGSGECLYKENETARMPIASVCKVMTLTLVFDAVKNGELSFADKIAVSENAAGMGGSQVFLEKDCEYSVDQLVKSIIVCSANDSCVALSETVAGGEEEFVARMNKKAEELGCRDTLFANCTGLPRETQYSCAKDVAIMFSNLIKNEEYFKYSKIWLEDFQHPDDRTISMTNTNKLIRKYSFCDGGKTGFTNEAGFCLASTAVKNNMRLVSVVLGASTSDDRFKSTINMFDYGFANFKNKIVLDEKVTLNDEFEVRGGKKSSFLVRPERNGYVFSAIDAEPNVSYITVANSIKAPVAENDVVGYIEIYKDNVLIDTVNVVAAENVEKASFLDYFKQNASEWAL
ncbi:MAG: D-alanyl-D-alanine carboxypeptidase [Clostridia bacterium]|jgi:D-alanyl-D-alanine carboxypeptidase (penicillin-binding protein 5/6)|nr:D-alanyl-D-alanine carboxypeptidase [Clostridia bacterium]